MNLLAVLLLSVGTLCMWIPSFLREDAWWNVLITLVLMLVNTMLAVYLYYQGNMTKMIDPFSALSFLFLSGSLVINHADWRGQVLTSILLLVVSVYQHIDRHRIESVAEKTFMIAILLGVASYFLPSSILLIIPCVLLLMYRQSFDGQSLLAILIGFGVVAIYAAIFIWLGWIDSVWFDFFSMQTLGRWLFPGTLLVAYIINAIAYSGDGIWKGIVYLSYLACCVAGWVVLLLLR